MIKCALGYRSVSTEYWPISQFQISMHGLILHLHITLRHVRIFLTSLQSKAFLCPAVCWGILRVRTLWKGSHGQRATALLSAQGLAFHTLTDLYSCNSGNLREIRGHVKYRADTIWHDRLMSVSSTQRASTLNPLIHLHIPSAGPSSGELSDYMSDPPTIRWKAAAQFVA